MDRRVTILFSIDGYNVLNRKPFIIWHTIDIIDAYGLSKFPKFENADVRILSSSAEGTSLNTAFISEVWQLGEFSTREFVRKKVKDTCSLWMFGLSQIILMFNDIKLAYKLDGSTYPKSDNNVYQLRADTLFVADIVIPYIESAIHHA